MEKKSFYSFVALYLLSSALFIVLLGFWYYTSQKNALENETYYKLNHIADTLAGRIINAQMKATPLLLPKVEDGISYELISKENAGNLKEGYFEKNNLKILLSKAPQEHLGVEFVKVQSGAFFVQLRQLQKQVLLVMFVSFLFIGIISFILSKIFMRPLHSRVQQIESFIQDVSHELNTPITALKMSASRGLQKGVYDKKILQNISISTKQLESIYKSLTFLNFSTKNERKEDVALKEIATNVISYYKELSDAKEITIVQNLEDATLHAVPSRIELIVSNLLSNAIKYSMPESTIIITLNKAFFSIKDEGVGIPKEKLDAIFKLYTRESNIAGGFGVGLNIVKQICDEYNIRVEVHSEIGEGSEFILHFPPLS